MRLFAIAGAALLGFATAAPAADFSDSTWPCVQRKVERLSPGLMWPAPIEDMEIDPDTAAAIDELAGRMALRRVSLDELTPRVADFVATHGTGTVLLGQVFQAAFDKLAAQRRAIITGIGEYSQKQIALAERIDGARVEMNRLMQADDPDFDRVDALEEQIAWDERIYTDRAQSLTYVCETPVLLEKRLHAIAQMLLEAGG